MSNSRNLLTVFSEFLVSIRRIIKCFTSPEMSSPDPFKKKKEIAEINRHNVQKTLDIAINFTAFIFLLLSSCIIIRLYVVLIVDPIFKVDAKLQITFSWVLHLFLKVANCHLHFARLRHFTPLISKWEWWIILCVGDVSFLILSGRNNCCCHLQNHVLRLWKKTKEK